MGDGCSSGHEDDEGAFAADKVDQELHEGIDGKCLASSASSVRRGWGCNHLVHVPEGLHV